MKKVNVIGTSGTGKTLFSKKLAHVLNSPYIEMDSIFWGQNWTKNADFLPDLEYQLNQHQTWVLDGNYPRSQYIKWEHCDTIIWLDYSFSLTMFQAFKRALSRLYSKEEIWSDTNNRETFKLTFCSRNSILLWTLKSYGRNKTQFLKLLDDKNLSRA